MKPYQEALVKFVARIAEMDPSYNDPDEGTFCVFCMARYGHAKTATGYMDWQVTHNKNCDYVEAQRLHAIHTKG